MARFIVNLTLLQMSVKETDEIVDDTDEDRCKYFDSLANIGVIGRCVMEKSLPQLAKYREMILF